MLIPPRGLFVTGTDTGVGKTTLAAALVAMLRAEGVRVGAYKPVASGNTVDANGSKRWEDIEKLAEALVGHAEHHRTMGKRWRSTTACGNESPHSGLPLPWRHPTRPSRKGAESTTPVDRRSGRVDRRL